MGATFSTQPRFRPARRAHVALPSSLQPRPCSMSSSQAATSSQKRKAPASSSASSSKKVNVSFEQASSSSGPLLGQTIPCLPSSSSSPTSSLSHSLYSLRTHSAANFPSVVPPSNVPFKLYRDRKADESKPLEEQLTLLAGETNGVEFYSTNRDNEPDVGEPVGGYPCR